MELYLIFKKEGCKTIGIEPTEASKDAKKPLSYK